MKKTILEDNLPFANTIGFTVDDHSVTYPYDTPANQIVTDLISYLALTVKDFNSVDHYSANGSARVWIAKNKDHLTITSWKMENKQIRYAAHGWCVDVHTSNNEKHQFVDDLANQLGIKIEIKLELDHHEEVYKHLQDFLENYSSSSVPIVFVPAVGKTIALAQLVKQWFPNATFTDYTHYAVVMRADEQLLVDKQPKSTNKWNDENQSMIFRTLLRHWGPYNHEEWIQSPSPRPQNIAMLHPKNVSKEEAINIYRQIYLEVCQYNRAKGMSSPDAKGRTWENICNRVGWILGGALLKSLKRENMAYQWTVASYGRTLALAVGFLSRSVFEEIVQQDLMKTRAQCIFKSARGDDKG